MAATLRVAPELLKVTGKAPLSVTLVTLARASLAATHVLKGGAK